MERIRKIRNKWYGENETEILIKLALEASREAIKESKALDLTIKLILDNKIIEESPNGERRVLRELDREPDAGNELKKGMILCRK